MSTVTESSNVVEIEGLRTRLMVGMEIEAIFGNPLRAAEANGAELPLMRELYQQLKAIQAQQGQPLSV